MCDEKKMSELELRIAELETRLEALIALVAPPEFDEPEPLEIRAVQNCAE